MKKLFLLSVLLLAVRTHADLSSFYTDDSEYFQKVYKDGFSIRFSVDRKDCQKIKKAEILLKVGDNSVTHPMAKASSTQKNWPDLYQIDESELCWFEGRVKGIDHNNENLYSLKLALNGKTLYFNEVSDSLIPHKRLKGQVENWLTPGAVGASPVIGGGTLFKVWEPESERVDITINQKKTHQLNTPLTNEKIHYLYLP
ncbi:MAG: hypothetical protein NXH75_11865 [Halobacteriovoraceae bacterium]|nr:hypothetical protein [Halobacteriovoraceae bacterium]